MIIERRSNRFHDTTRFGHPQVRIYPRKGTGKKCSRYLLKCGCCGQKLEIYYAEDGLEIGGSMEPLRIDGKFFFPFEEEKRKTLKKLDRGGEKMINFNWLQEGGNAHARG